MPASSGSKIISKIAFVHTAPFVPTPFKQATHALSRGHLTHHGNAVTVNTA